MKTILNLNCEKWLFPDAASAARAMTLLSKALPVEVDYERTAEGDYRVEHYRVKDDERRGIELKQLSSQAMISGQPVKPAKGKKPASAKLLLLE